MYIIGENIDDDIIKEFGKFSILWNLFEKSFCGNHCNSGNIKEKCADLTISAEILLKFKAEIKKRKGNQTADEYVRTRLHPSNANPSPQEDILLMTDFIDGKSQNEVVDCLLIINRIRNNLLHGLKSFHILKEQKELFQNVNNVLENIIMDN